MTKFNNFDIHSVHSIMKQRNSAINEYVDTNETRDSNPIKLSLFHEKSNQVHFISLKT